VFDKNRLGIDHGPVTPSAKPKEPDAIQVFNTWKTSRNPQTTQQLLDVSMPAITKAVKYYTRGQDPVAISYGKRLAIDALDRYDPKMSSLGTFINRQLQPMMRWQASRSKGVKIPDRIVAESADLYRANTELADILGRDPSIDELADHSGIPVSRIAKVRAATPLLMAGSTVVEKGEGGDDADASDMAVERDTSMEWANFIRHDLNETDKIILDHTIGLGGADILPNKQLAAKLKITPAAISQRKARIQLLLDRQSDLSPFG
jgi:DNA-directed RNA polymerase specialized sigma subunit